MPILVVDDEPVFRSAVNAMLRRAGFQTIEARDGLEAYEIVRATGASIQLLLTDGERARTPHVFVPHLFRAGWGVPALHVEHRGMIPHLIKSDQ